MSRTDSNLVKKNNPVIRADYPDPDVIRVGDVYYMLSSTFHFLPGAVILRSYDLLNWEIASYVFDTFRFEALHFIVKPIKTSEFEDVFRRAINKYKSTHSTINLKWQNERYTINISDITYIEGYNRHITVHTPDESYEAVGKISDIENELGPLGFIRVHQGFIVNMDRIKRFDANDVILQDNSRIMISVRKHTEALKAYDNYIQKWKW